jgi:ketopantoate hydroxymethyltransferase
MATTFAYSGRSRAGQNVTGERIADTLEAAVAALRREQILVTAINPIKEQAAAKAPKKARTKSVGAKEMAIFTRQFSVMIDAGLPLVQCLEILGNQEEDKNFSAVILSTRGEVESGASLVLIEAVPNEVSIEVVKLAEQRSPVVPVIGCGAGSACHGHVVVLQDLLGMTPWQPPFAPPMADVGEQIRAAAHPWAQKIERGEYLRDDHPYKMID